jgi:hypothetical protein
MDKYVRWFAGLDKYQQLLLAFGFVFGIAAFATAAATDNPVFLALALFWLVVAPAAVWVIDSYEDTE